MKLTLTNAHVPTPQFKRSHNCARVAPKQLNPYIAAIRNLSVYPPNAGYEVIPRFPYDNMSINFGNTRSTTAQPSPGKLAIKQAVETPKQELGQNVYRGVGSLIDLYA